MFKNHDIVTDEDVGNFVKQLAEDAEREINEELGVTDEVVTNSRKPTSWPQGKTRLSGVRGK